MIDIRGLTPDERIHRLILESALKQQQQSMFVSSDTTRNITESESIELFTRIESRVYYILESPRFEYTDINGETKSMSCLTMKHPDISSISISILSESKKHFAFYNIRVDEHGSFMIRGYFLDDVVIIRQEKIDQILGTES